MKKLLSEAAIRAKRIFLAIASFFSTLWAKVLSTFRKSKNAEAKTTYSLNNKSSAGGAGKHVSAAGGKVLSFFKRLPALAVKYRLAVSCIMVVIIGAIVIGVALGGKSSKTFKGDQQALHSSDNPAAVTQSPQNTEPGSTDDPGAAMEQPGDTDPAETTTPQATHNIYITPVPIVSMRPVDETRDVAKAGEHNDVIPDVQERLMILWYMDQDEPTDYFGNITKNALRVFQRRNELEVTGRLDPATYELLMSNDAKAYLCMIGDSGQDVVAVKQRLYELGYVDTEDGGFDEAMEAGVKEFQAANDLSVDGKVGRNTKEALYNPECVPKAFNIGDSGDNILLYQNRLQKLGYLTTEPDGIYGTDTQMAVRRFQEQNSLIADGYLGPITRDTLMSDDAVGNALSYSMHGSDVKNVQQRLYELNYLRAKNINSYYTSLTEKAVKLFQKNNGLTVDGKVGRHTMNVLFSDDAVRASSPVTDGGTGGGGGGGGGGSNPTPKPSDPDPDPDPGEGASERIDRFIRIARSKLGSRYVRGGKGPNVFDCSGFVYWCINKAGISQGYMTSYMWRSCTRYQRNNNINNVKRGDVIVYYGHVAICSGNWTMIDASQSNGRVVERSFNSNYWHRNFICSFRIFR